MIQYTDRITPEEIMDRYGSVMCMAERVPDALADDLCNMAYMVRLKEKKDIDLSALEPVEP